MRKFWILSLIFFVQCGSGPGNHNSQSLPDRKDTTVLLEQYWILADAEGPLVGDVITKEGGRDFLPGMVFLSNGELVANPGGDPVRGKYQRTNASIQVKFENGKEADYTIEVANPDSLIVKRTVGKDVSTLHYYATDTWWPDIQQNPFTAENMKWMQKPTQPESDAQIKERCKEYVSFFEHYLSGYLNGGATKVSSVGLPNVLNFYEGAMTIQPDDKLNSKWVACFYDQGDALKAYTLLRHTILKSYNWDKNAKNWVEQTVPVLKQVQDSL